VKSSLSGAIARSLSTFFDIGERFNGCECHSTSVTGRIARRPMLPVHCRWMFCVGCIRQIDKLQAPSSLTFDLKHRSSS